MKLVVIGECEDCRDNCFEHVAEKSEKEDRDIGNVIVGVLPAALYGHARGLTKGEFVMSHKIRLYVSVASALVVALVLTTGASTVQAGLLAGYWNFDGGSAADSSGNGYNGTLNGTIAQDASGKFGGALKSTSAADSSYVHIASGARLDNTWGTTGGFTLSLWVKGTGAAAQVVSKYDERPTSAGGVYLYDTGWGTTDAATGAFNGYDAATTSYTNGAWHNLVIRYNPTDRKVYAYNNGTAGTPVTHGTLGAVNSSGKPLDLFAPGTQYPAGAFGFVGSMDDVAYFDSTLTDAECKSIYNVGNSTLGYSMADMGLLFEVYGGSDRKTTSDGKTWQYATGLSGAAGELAGSAGSYSIVLGAGLDGVQQVPEPGALALLTSGLIGLLAYAWRRRR